MRGALIDIRRRKSFQRIAGSESKRGRSVAASTVANVS
jgi:hypothetical protein